MPADKVKRFISVGAKHHQNFEGIVQTRVGALIIHLGMSGSFRVVPEGTPPGKHDHYDIRAGGNVAIRYTDPRRFGCLLFTDTDPLLHPRLRGLGVEPLSPDFTADYLYDKSKNRNIPVKTLIMDGAVVVGVGNIYASEALFLSGIHPLRRCSRISLDRYSKLAGVIVSVLENAIVAGGTTLKDFSRVDGQPGYFEQDLLVYGRTGDSCVNCGTPVVLKTVSQRSTYYCPACQT